MYQNAGEKGTPHRTAADPPRRRANKRRGHGTYATDRPPILGIVGRTSGDLRVMVLHHADAATLAPLVEGATQPDTTVYTDEWRAYQGIARPHATVCHHPDHREWARDDDGDGLREVHSNTIEGIWTGLRNFLRPFRGVHKKYLQQYIAVFAWAFHLKRVTTHFLRLLLCPFISLPT